MKNEMTAEEVAERMLHSAELLSEMQMNTPVDDDVIALEDAVDVLQKIASGEYAPVVHAHWKEVEPGHDVLFECSNCGRIISTSWGCCEDEDTKGCNGCDPTEEWLCCPTCRALMDGKDDSNAD
ncbi:MAG: hypothetical protein PHE09_20585 [Oscillospiraceae bacterium]|nr:hypothetical protein [Oscillospiraceae bacterium]